MTSLQKAFKAKKTEIVIATIVSEPQRKHRNIGTTKTEFYLIDLKQNGWVCTVEITPQQLSEISLAQKVRSKFIGKEVLELVRYSGGNIGGTGSYCGPVLK